MARISSDRWHRFLYPKRIAVVGASPSRAETGMLLGNLRRSGFAGEIVPVNPTRQDVSGLPCSASLSDAGAVDAAVLLVARERVEAVVREAIACDVGGIIVMAAGFRESGVAEWMAAESRFCEAATAAGIPLIGTNCLGVVSGPGGAAMSIGPWQPPPRGPGGVALVMQSGGVMSGARRYVEEQLGSGVRWEFSLGNASAVGFADVLDHLVEDPGLTAVTLLVEQIRDPAGLRAAVARLHERNVLVTAEVIGKSAGGQQAAMSHTGSLAAPYRIVRDFLRQLGLPDTDSLGEALAAAAIRDRLGPPPGGPVRLGVLGVSGGTAGLVTDLAAANGLPLPTPPPAVTTELATIAPMMVASNPMDIIGGAAHPDVLTAVVDTFLRHVDVDVALYVPSQGLPTDLPPGHVAAVDAVVAAAVRREVPLIITQVVNNAIDADRAARQTGRPGVLVVPTVAEALAGLRIWSGGNRVERTADAVRESGGGSGHTEPELKRLLAEAGCAVPRAVLVRDPGDGVSAAVPPFPVIVKGVSRSVTHKTAAGLVRPDVATAEQLDAAVCAVVRNAATAGAELAAVLVEAMVGAGVDVVVSVFQSRLGTTALLGRGGVDVETEPNVRFVVLPVTPEDLERVLRDVDLPVDAVVLVDLVERMCQVYRRLGLSLLELNPVRFLPDGRAVVLDAVGG